MKTVKKKLRKTRNIMLFLACGMVILYTVANVLFGVLNVRYDTVFQFDPTQTTEWFSFWKWVVVSGGGITIAKTLKGNTNSDEEEKDGVV